MHTPCHKFRNTKARLHKLHFELHSLEIFLYSALESMLAGQKFTVRKREPPRLRVLEAINKFSKNFIVLYLHFWCCFNYYLYSKCSEFKAQRIIYFEENSPTDKMVNYFHGKFLHLYYLQKYKICTFTYVYASKVIKSSAFKLCIAYIAGFERGD